MQVDWIDSQSMDAAIELLADKYTEYSLEELAKQVSVQRQKFHYLLIGVWVEDELVGVIGFTEGMKLSWGKYILLDDFCVAHKWEYTGVAEKLIAWLQHYGEQTGCRQLHMNCDVQNFAAHKFLLQEGFQISSHHFSYHLASL